MMNVILFSIVFDWFFLFATDSFRIVFVSRELLMMIRYGIVELFSGMLYEVFDSFERKWLLLKKV